MTKQQAQNPVPCQSGPAHRAASIEMTAMVRELDKALHILRVKQLIERTNLSRATLYVLMSSDPHLSPQDQADGTFDWLPRIGSRRMD